MMLTVSDRLLRLFAGEQFLAVITVYNFLYYLLREFTI